MSIRSIPLAEATADQARSFATDFLNIDIEADANEATVRAAIERAQPGVSTIFAQEADTPIPAEGEPIPPALLKPEEVTGKLAGTLGQGDPRAVIEIPMVETDDDSGAADVFVGVNGRHWQLKRGVALNVPWRVVAALDLTVATIVRHDDAGDEVRHDAKRLPYHFIEKPSAAEIDAWHERTKDEFCA